MSNQVESALAAMKESDEKYFSYAPIVWDGLTTVQRDVLKQLLFQGPVYDGHIISKSDRNYLMSVGLAVRVCYLGEQGYTAATYPAFTVFERGGGTPIKAKSGERG